MAVSINVLSTFNDAGLKKARAEMDKLNKSVTKGIGKGVKVAAGLGAGVLGAAGTAAGAMVALGATFDDAYDKLRANTGKSGAELDALKASLNTVATTTATSFGEAADVLATLSSKLGTTGKPLEDLAKNLIDLSRITGTDLKSNVDNVSKVMQNFGVVAAYQAPALDVLYRASQNTGISVTDLSSQMASSGAVLRSAGFDFQTSAALVASLAKAGLDASDVMPGLSRAVADAGKKGIDASTYLGDAFNKIKNAPTDIDGAKAAVDTFGKKGAKMAEIIRSGALSFDDLKASLSEGDSVSKAAADTEDFAEKFTKLKNRIMAAIEPFADKAFSIIGDIMDWLGPKVEQVTKYFQEHEGVAKVVAAILGGALVIALIAVNVQLVLMAINVLAATWPFVLIIVVIGLIVAAFIWLWNNVDWFREGVIGAFNLIKDGFFAFLDIVKTVFNSVWDAIQWLWDKFNWIKDGLGTVFNGVKDAIIGAFKAAFNMVVTIWNGTIGGLGFDIPDWVPGIGGKSFKVPELTQWAHTGGIVGGMPGANVPMMLQTGEMVLSQDQQAILLGRINGAGGGNQYAVNVTVAPTADKAAVGQAVVESIKEFERRSGSSWRAA